MDKQMIYVYQQKQQLNDETDRFHLMFNNIINYGKPQEEVSQVIVINGQ